MANNKIDRINKEIAKTREKITEYQNKLKGLEAQKTEAENLEIVQLVRPTTDFKAYLLSQGEWLHGLAPQALAEDIEARHRAAVHRRPD